MRIAVLGAGAMGALFGGYLSLGNDVLLVDVNQALVEKSTGTVCGLKNRTERCRFADPMR